MASTLDEVLAEVGLDLATDVRLRAPGDTHTGDLPIPLQDLYARCDGGDIAFGTIYTAREAIQRQSLEPFAPHWVPFGDDSSGSFWLCALKAVGDHWFTSWDHESGSEIGEPHSALVAPFLREQYEKRLAARSGESNYLVISAVPTSATAAAALELKRLLAIGTAEAVERLKQLPIHLPIRSVVEAKAALGRLRPSGVQGHLKLDFF